MLRIVAVTVIAGCLAGCGPSRDHLAAAHNERCLGYGMAFGSPQYQQCRQSLDQQHSDQRFQRQQLILSEPLIPMR